MRSRRILPTGSVAAGLAIAGLGPARCGTGQHAAPAASPAGDASGGSAPESPSTTSPATAISSAGNVAPGAPVLRSIRTGHFASYDRLVFQFAGGLPPYRFSYVPGVTEDPSGRPVSLA